ncbi:MAG: glutamate--tRNA ligase [Gammaproteobacteria bacterium]|nr:MAG: glutamate--tRNA ligase [Gammaproteobacteria bacterium]TLZ00158.1 MAG: glutamate--tRNA ligase [Gammaproteobacteria bacterium]TLZ14693.1 MAG: glutamate--tRNA ligase [Gammaproteobacteria bacterium]
MTVVTRFAPSPTGLLHVGGVRTALFSWLYARRNGGNFILRVEDTDRERSTDEAVRVILDGMAWLGLDADEGPYFQSRRFDRYREVLRGMLEAGTAYHCYCSKDELDALRGQQIARKQKPRYTGICRERREPRPGVDPVVRFRNPLDGAVVVQDLVHGPVTFQNAELDDLIIARSDGTPTYNFCVVVDDMDMGVTHVIRGDDHLNNTPRQMNMLQALGAPLPIYAHVPMILGPDGAKLSKRHGAVSVLQYEEEGYLPDALLNYLVRLGWSHGDQEVFTREEMIAAFDIHDVNKSASAFNPEKLLWLNQQHMMRAMPAALVPHLRAQLRRLGADSSDQQMLEGVILAQRERAKTMKEMAVNSRFFFVEDIELDLKAAAKHLGGDAPATLAKVRARLGSLSEWNAASVHAALEQLAAELGGGLGKIAQPLRVAVSGSAVSPPIDATLALLGRERTLARVDAALAGSRPAPN